MGGDCDDTDAAVHPGASEDAIRMGDEDCDGHGVGSLSDADVIFQGPRSGSRSGFALANVGDVTGDAVADLLVGAPYQSDYRPQPGDAFLVPGDPVAGLRVDPSSYFTVFGESDGDYTGCDVLGAGDMDDDGANDIWIGAPFANGEDGAAYLVLGPVTADLALSEAHHTYLGDSAAILIGCTVVATGDLNGDGSDDFVLGSHNNDEMGGNTGAAYAFFGPVTGGTSVVSAAADATVFGALEGGFFGGAGSAADFDGDGYADLAVGAYGADAVYFFEGGPAWSGESVAPSRAVSTLVGATSGEKAGAPLAAADGLDLTGDGRPDLVVGASDSTCGGENSGALNVVDEPLVSATLPVTTGARICGDPGDQVGVSDFSVGDWDGDGVGDLLVGLEQGEKVYLFPGPLGGERVGSDNAVVFHGESALGHAGQRVTFFDDTDGDGVMEIAIGDDAAGSAGQGRAYLVWGGRLAP